MKVIEIEKFLYMGKSSAYTKIPFENEFRMDKNCIMIKRLYDEWTLDEVWEGYHKFEGYNSYDDLFRYDWEPHPMGQLHNKKDFIHHVNSLKWDDTDDELGDLMKFLGLEADKYVAKCTTCKKDFEAENFCPSKAHSLLCEDDKITLIYEQSEFCEECKKKGEEKREAFWSEVEEGRRQISTKVKQMREKRSLVLKHLRSKGVDAHPHKKREEWINVNGARFTLEKMTNLREMRGMDLFGQLEVDQTKPEKSIDDFVDKYKYWFFEKKGG